MNKYLIQVCTSLSGSLIVFQQVELLLCLLSLWQTLSVLGSSLPTMTGLVHTYSVHFFPLWQTLSILGSFLPTMTGLIHIEFISFNYDRLYPYHLWDFSTLLDTIWKISVMGHAKECKKNILNNFQESVSNFLYGDYT